VRYVRPVRGHGTETIGFLVTQTSSTPRLDTTDSSELPEAFLSRLDGRRRRRAWRGSDSRLTRTPLHAVNGDHFRPWRIAAFRSESVGVFRIGIAH
jgi:hypothetical protein